MDKKEALYHITELWNNLNSLENEHSTRKAYLLKIVEFIEKTPLTSDFGKSLLYSVDLIFKDYHLKLEEVTNYVDTSTPPTLGIILTFVSNSDFEDRENHQIFNILPL